MNLYDIESTALPIEHEGTALVLKAAAINAARNQEPRFVEQTDDEIWEVLRCKVVSFDLLVSQVGAIADLLDKHERRLDKLDPPKAGGA